MSSSPDTSLGRTRPRTRSVTQSIGEESTAPQQIPERQWSELPPLVNSRLEEDTMPYPYSKYRDGADAEAHIRDFLTTWEINHAAQRLSAATEGKSKIDEFVQSLDGPLANWFAQNGIRAFKSFEQLTTKFTQLFHRQIPQKDLIGQFYAAYQEPNETLSQFFIWFQSLQLQIAKTIPDAELKDIFLKTIGEPLRTTLAMFDFTNQTIDQVIDKALAMDRTHKSKPA